MNEEFEEVEAILKPTPMKRRVVCLIITIALALLTGLGILLFYQVEYLQVFIICYFEKIFALYN